MVELILGTCAVILMVMCTVMLMLIAISCGVELLKDFRRGE